MKFIENNLEISNNNKIGISGLTNETLSIYINTLFNNKEDIIVVTNTLYEANKIFQSLQNYNSNVLLFPMDEFLTSEAIAMSPDLKITRVETINKLIDKKDKTIVVTHLMGILRYLPNKQTWENHILKLRKKNKINKDELIEKLYSIGYATETLVTKTGEMANRGFILDVFPVNEENAIRIEFWGDEIESIRYFDIDSQLSLKEIEKIKIYPFDEFICDDKDSIRKQKYLPLYSEVSSILYYLNNPTVVYKDIKQIKNAYLNLREEIFNYDLNQENKNETNYMHNLEGINTNSEIYIMDIDNVLNDIKLDSIIHINSKSANYYNGDFKKLNEELKSYILLNKTVIICLESDHQIKIVKSYIDMRSVITTEKEIFNNSINLIKKKIDDGFIYNDYIVLSNKNLYKINENKSVYKSKFKYGIKINNINKLNIGDFVVHNIHGIGMYMGIVALDKGGIIKDYLQIKYKDNEKLYIPVEKIELITKYSSNEGITPKLSKLGGTEWQKTKMRVKSRLHDIAFILIKISAERASKKGYAFSKDTEEQLEFESEFIYEETKDQLIATAQIKEDMEKESPMDRLLCGDVGYGKTEVALRAMFKAVCDNKQVAYLCPTTLLSNQQYMNSLERFKNFPINIELLNRFTTVKKVKEILNGLKNKTIDIVFGTHRLLSKDVIFKDLGLLVIDEEQRFGVMHKEKIKEYKSNVDVLTLSATPIPRTLQMAMVGLRNLSLIETPPINRYPVQTYVLEENDYIIKDAIYKEMTRNGQTYVLYNRIEDIEDKVRKIQDLVPDAKICYAHGKMNKSEIENIMMAFIKKEYDVLVCTTIIETGIDITNVNTLIIMDADKFGLSQLYQIRGRVGRTNRIAYAYLMYNKRKVLNDVAVKRLNVIKEFTELGSGFSIALRDLSIRGAGDLLGKEQSGFIDSIGIDLYIKMLNEEVDRIKGIEKENIGDTNKQEEQPLINIATHIEDAYVKEDDLKIEIHKKINQIDNYEKLLDVKQELEDRFGKLSETMLLYMYEEWFDVIAREKGVEKVNQTKKSVELVFNSDASSNLNINDLYVKAYEICSMFRFAFLNKKLSIILDINKLEKHWLYCFLNLINKM